MKVLLTGGAGYLGSVLLPKLLRRNHEVKVLDVGYFGVAHLKSMLPYVEFHREDITQVCSDTEALDKLLEGVDAIIHLAAMSNDPSADLDPAITTKVNTRATEHLARAAKARGIRFCFASSCSVYGGGGELIDENGAKSPLTTYAISKLQAEDILVKLADDKWKPVILRNGTLFGYSPRMRFDLVVNIFALFSVLRQEIRVFGNGEHWRPFLHVDDCARAFVYFAEKKDPKHLIYNVAHENLRVKDVAEMYAKLTPGLKVNIIPAESEDKRDYRVVAHRVREDGFETRRSVLLGAEELQDAIVNGAVVDPESLLYQNVKWLKQLGLNPSRTWFRRAA